MALQNLHLRFKSGRRLQFSLTASFQRQSATSRGDHAIDRDSLSRHRRVRQGQAFRYSL